jgi:hypothetical protein
MKNRYAGATGYTNLPGAGIIIFWMLAAEFCILVLLIPYFSPSNIFTQPSQS